MSGTAIEGLLSSQSNLEQDNAKFVRIEVPLRNNEEFFQILRHEISHLSKLHDQEKTTLGQEIHDVGLLVSQIAHPVRNGHRTDLSAWKAVFGLYLECNIFFSTTESENFNRTPKEAERQLQVFSRRLDEMRRTTRFHRKESNITLQRFMLINANLLRSLKFQHLNMRAAGKILKKLNKRTSLGGLDPSGVMIGAEALSPELLAKQLCSQLSNEILSAVPQLSDYLCPVCFGISYKPIRLQCGHVFCIRCMVVMQRSRQANCPLCRGNVIMQADSANLDLALMNFLKAFFPAEVKQKQKDNERNSGVDQYGSDYEKHQIDRKSSQNIDDVDWKQLFQSRHLADIAIGQDFEQILVSQTGRIDGSGRIIAHGYDAKDLLLGHANVPDDVEDGLARRYYSDAVLGGIHRAAAVDVWFKLKDGGPVSLEKALAAFDHFVLQDRVGDFEEYKWSHAHQVSVHLDQIAHSILLQTPDILEATPRRRAQDIARHLLENQYVGVTDSSHYRDLQNNFIGVALQNANRSALPLISVGIYCAVSKRLGLNVQPCGFPFHVYAIVKPMDGQNVDGRRVEGVSEPQVMYMDPFRSDKEVAKDDLRAQLRALGVLPGDHELLLGTCTVADMVRRAARNIIGSVQSTPHLQDRGAAASFHRLEPDSALYSALWALLILPEDNAPMVQRARYLPYILDHLEKQFLVDVHLVEKFVLPLFKGSQHWAQLWQAVRAMRASDTMPKQVKPRTSDTDKHVHYTVGHVFRHKRYSYQGVITGWDVECAAGETWMSQMGVDRLSRGRHQSFYHVLVEDKSVRYVAEENIDKSPGDVGSSLMALAGRHFKRWDSTSRMFISNIKDEYPND
ncbi:MAG: hypothetical protein Q9220_004500 [cf. Caloplaca sp. 1 TL-2023]